MLIAASVDHVPCRSGSPQGVLGGVQLPDFDGVRCRAAPLCAATGWAASATRAMTLASNDALLHRRVILSHSFRSIDAAPVFRRPFYPSIPTRRASRRLLRPQIRFENPRELVQVLDLVI